jgi:hypothetical protein
MTSPSCRADAASAARTTACDARPPLRALFIVPQGRLSAGPRYRVFQYLPRFAALGIESDVAVMQGPRSTLRSVNGANLAPPVRVLHRLGLGLQRHVFIARVIPRLGRFDRIVIYRFPIPTWACRYLAPHRDRVIFDFDDAIDQPERESRGLDGLRAKILRRGLENAVRVSAVMVTSNQRNAAVVEALGGQVVVVPTCVDVSAVARPTGRQIPAHPAILGWTGTSTTASYLADIEGPLARVLDHWPAEVRLIGAGRSPFVRLPATLRPWSLEHEATEIGQFDVGLMPMPDTAWTRGKAALKALLYGASGVPTVASWTETNAEILGSEDGAMLCRTDDEWFEALRRLIEDPLLRMEIGTRARARVATRYSLDVMAPRLYRVIVEAPGLAGR